MRGDVILRQVSPDVQVTHQVKSGLTGLCLLLLSLWKSCGPSGSQVSVTGHQDSVEKADRLVVRPDWQVSRPGGL